MVEIKTLMETHNGKWYKNVVGVFIVERETPESSSVTTTTASPVKGTKQKGTKRPASKPVSLLNLPN